MQKSLFKLSWPIYVELLFFMMLGIADTLMLSQYSDLSVAAVGNAQRITNLFTVLLNVVAIGVGVVVAQYLGANKEKDAKTAIKSGLFTNVLVALVLVIILQIAATGLYSLIRVDESIYSDSITYFRITVTALLFIAMTQASSAGFKSFGKTKLVMLIVGCVNILNVILNFFFIFGIGIVPELGVQGAAIASFISKGTAMVLVLIFLYVKLDIHPFFLKFAPLKNHFFKIIKIGVPSALEHFVYQFTQVIILSFLNTIGTFAVTTHVYIHNMTLPVLVFSLALAQGNMVIVGWNVGAFNYDQAFSRTITTLKKAIVVVLGVSVLMYLNAETILGIFTDNQEIISMGRNAMLIVIALEVGRLTNLVVIFSLRASGDVIFPVVIAIISMLGLTVGLSYVLGLRLELGLIGIMIGLASDECMRGILVFTRWLKRDWVGKQVAH